MFKTDRAELTFALKQHHSESLHFNAFRALAATALAWVLLSPMGLQAEILSPSAKTEVSSSTTLPEKTKHSKGSKHQHDKAEKSPVIFHFSSVGDSRTDERIPGISQQDKRWLTASPVLSRMIKEISHAKSEALFFNGDMIMGYSKDPVETERQYAFWRGMMATLMQAGTYVVPVPGNHEVQMPTKTPEGTVKLAQPYLEKQWRDNMGDLIIDLERWNQIVKKPITYWDINNTSTPDLDKVQTPQTQLNYSFDVGQIHFAVINTDPVGSDNVVSSSWLARDFEQAKARGAITFLAFGHKMPFTYFPEVGGKKAADGLDVKPAERDAFWSVIENYGATYFCGHEHVYDASQPLKAQGGKAWQIIVGSGGSPFSVKKEDTRNPKDRMYAWADVLVRKNGALSVRILGFDEEMGPTKVISKWTIQPSLLPVVH
jgi:hypothetical protein